MPVRFCFLQAEPDTPITFPEFVDVTAIILKAFDT
jgi:hypothetical protein